MTTASLDRQIELEREDAARQALELAARRLESENVNDVYRAALKRGAKIIRNLRNSADFSEILKRQVEQIR
jgi:hypothetical protein